MINSFRREAVALGTVLATVLIGSLPAQAGLWFNGPKAEGNWTDVGNWYTYYYYRSQDKATSIYFTTDVNMEMSQTAIVDTDITKSQAAYWSLAIGSNLDSNDRYATLRIENGGKLVGSTNLGKVEVGKKLNNRAGYGLIDVQPGGEFGGWLHIGVNGFGVVTNAGTITLSDMHLGVNAGAKGTYVLDNGSVPHPNAKDIYVGENGEGELVVKAGTFSWYWYVNKERTQFIGYQRIGCGTEGTGKGTVVIEDGTTFQNGVSYYGGDATTWGDGLLRMRGGTYQSQAEEGQHGIDTLWIGAGQDSDGSVRAGSHGEIRGWGVFSCYEDGAKPKAICARLGNGAIIADGEGVERTLDCSAMWQVTNVLFCAEADRTNGWYAVNKGAVVLPIVNAALDANGGDNWGCSVGTNAVGCCRSLKKPDLLNAVRICATRGGWAQAGWHFGAMVLAADRSDAHADALGAGYAPLGFWKLGTFGDRKLSAPRSYSKARAKFRYDARKISKSDSRIAVLRWDAETGKWKRLNRHSVQPADGIAESGEFTGSSGDADWTLGTFCVAEDFARGALMIVR